MAYLLPYLAMLAFIGQDAEPAAALPNWGDVFMAHSNYAAAPPCDEDGNCEQYSTDLPTVAIKAVTCRRTGKHKARCRYLAYGKPCRVDLLYFRSGRAPTYGKFGWYEPETIERSQIRCRG